MQRSLLGAKQRWAMGVNMKDMSCIDRAQPSWHPSSAEKPESETTDKCPLSLATFTQPVYKPREG